MRVADVPRFVLDAVSPPKVARTAAATRLPAVPTGYGTRALTAECESVAGAVEGERNHALNRASFNLAQLVASGVLDESLVRSELAAAAARAGLGDREVESTINSGMRGGLRAPRTARPLPARPRQREPGDDDDRDDTAPTAWDLAVEQARADLALAGIGSVNGAGLGGPFFSPTAELFSRQFPGTPWLVRGLLTKGAVFAVAGEPKTAKTWGALEIAMALGTDTPAFGEFETIDEPCGVALFLVEDDAQSTRNRLRALAAARGMAPEEACARLYVENLAALDVSNPEQLARLVASVRAIPTPVGAVVIDPMRNVHTGEENDSKEMDAVMRAFRAVRTVLGCAVVFVHHSQKAGPEGRARRPGQRMRGSSAIHAGVDGGLYLLDLTGNLVSEWEMKALAEVKRARSAGFFSLKLTVEDDEAGEAVAACWTFERSGAGARGDPIQTAHERIEALAGVLRAADRPLGVREMERRLNVRHGEVTSPLRDLERRGDTRKTRKGWVWVTSESAVPGPVPPKGVGTGTEVGGRSPGPTGTDGDGDTDDADWLGGAA